jgi:predicted CxxxxCH...CXXCH cytochrome family protein
MRTPSPRLPAALLVLLALSACAGTDPAAPPPSNECTACHGDASRAASSLNQAAPPKDAHGNTATTQVTVGAHQAHLSANVTCATCHVVPPANDSSHYAAPYATVTFAGNVVGAHGATVAPWNRDTPTCANYCHGATMPEAAVPTPSWTLQGGLGCGSCHSAQDTVVGATGIHYRHVVTAAIPCATCHGSGYAPSGVTGTAVATHADATIQLTAIVDWQDPVCGAPPRQCAAACHGSTPPTCRFWP